MTEATSSRELAEGDRLGNRDLVVVGAGPVGLAALWFARRYGTNAMALDAGQRPLDSLRSFATGTVTASNALEWEIDGLPVDCRNVTEITREDLLSYYTRVSSLGRLQVALGQNVVAVRPSDDGVKVVVRTRDGIGHWLARRVLVTSWFRKRRLDWCTEGVNVHDRIEDAASFQGQQVVIIGAGMSGLEAADILVRAGSRVTILSTGTRQLPPDLVTLLRLSGSQIIQNVERVGVARRDVLAVLHDGGSTEVPCSAVINCTGQELNRAVTSMLRDSGLLDDRELSALETFRRFSALEAAPLPEIAAQLPNLSDALWSGRRGVHFAGTIFHVGGTRGAGIQYSIETAHWATAALTGRTAAGAPSACTHLPGWFVERMLERRIFKRGPRWSAPLESIIPVPIPTWSRGTKLFEFETADGKEADGVSRRSRALGDARTEDLSALRGSCYDGLTVGQLAERRDGDKAQLLRALALLWYNNGLTWLPPALARA
jgi:thioredoxin reductase